jgi:hypothetical protein
MFKKKGNHMKVNLLPQVRLFLFQCLMTMVVALPMTSANAQYHGGYGGYGQGQPVTSHVNSYLQEGDRINITLKLQLAQLMQQGKDLVSLSVKAQSTSYGAKLVLKLNGQRLQEKQIGSYLSDTQFQIPKLMMQDKLVVVVKGGAFIQSISGQVQSPMGSAPGHADVLKAQINQQIFGQDVLAVRQLVKQATGVQLKGAKVDKVLLKANSLRGHAQAQLLIDGRPVGFPQTIQAQKQRIVFNLPKYARNVIGQDIQSIKIKIQGKLHVQMVALVLQQGRTHGSTDSVQIQVNQRIQGSQRLALSQLMGYGQQAHMQKQIEAVTIVAQGQGSIMAAGAGRGQGGIQVHGPTTQSLNLMGQSVTPAQLKLRIQGNIVIKSIRIKFKSLYW